MSQEDFAAFINAAAADGWMRAMGVKLTKATADLVEAELEVGPVHLQPYGIVHGGVHSGLIESIASIGAALNVTDEGKSVVGLENQTSFVRAVRGGKLTATARPLTRGRRSHLWDAAVHDAEGRLVATGRVRLMVLEAESPLAGEPVAIKGR